MVDMHTGKGNRNMSIILKELYEETKSRYGLSLIAGETGLEKSVNWIYIAESLAGPGYLSGGELIITTGVLCRESPDWLYDFVRGMIRENTCGLILNTGKYIQPEHITSALITLCNDCSFPLFTMPWETLLSDVTHDYYSRIFTDSKRQEAIDHTLLNLVHRRGDVPALLSELEEYGYPADQPYGLIYISYSAPRGGQLSRQHADSQISLSAEHLARSVSLQGHLCRTDTYCFFMVSPRDLHRLNAFGKSLAESLQSHFPDAHIAVGIGSRAATLANLPRAFFHARCSALIAASRRLSFLSFEELGVFQLLLSVNDKGVLQDYMRRRLFTVEQYDQKTGGNYTEVLQQYLLCSGSIQKIADNLYCHRNTINKKVRILKEELGYHLDDPMTCFELLLAYCIRDYLRIPL